MLIEKRGVKTNIYDSSSETEYPTEYLTQMSSTSAMKQSYSEGNQRSRS
jgi:hypothetical protein